MSEQRRIDILRTELQRALKTGNVYINPPPNSQMRYPAAIIQIQDSDVIYADNKPYKTTTRYQVMLVNKSMKLDWVDTMLRTFNASHERDYIADTLYHHVFNLYF